MNGSSLHTAYACLPPRRARAALAAWAIGTALCVAITLSPAASRVTPKGRPGVGDNALYWAIANRVSAGEDFYQASAQELSARHYPMASVFNWRVPLPIAMVGWVRYPWIARLMLGAIGLGVLLLGVEMLVRERHRLQAALGALLLTGPLGLCVLDDLFVMPVLWAGAWIALSVCAYDLKWRRLAVVAGLAAPFFREVALPYCLLSAALAWRDRRPREVAVWAAGLAVWGLYFAYHCVEVLRVMPANAPAFSGSWIQFGGLPFAIATTQMNPYLLVVPQWVTGLYFAAGLFALAGWNTPAGRRIAATVCLFVILFAVVGRPFNYYWGLLTAPLFCLSVSQFPGALADCWRAARWCNRVAA